MNKKCSICKRSFKSIGFSCICSKKCADEYQTKYPERTSGICLICGEIFPLRFSGGRFKRVAYCPECLKTRKSQTDILRCCRSCGDLFIINRGIRQYFCSKDCKRSFYQKAELKGIEGAYEETFELMREWYRSQINRWLKEMGGELSRLLNKPYGKDYIPYGVNGNNKSQPPTTKVEGLKE